MSLTLMYITNKPEIAIIAEKAGVDRIFVDLERRGKAERQLKVNSVKSNHSIEDAKSIKKVLKKSQLLIRLNSYYDGTQNEVDAAVEAGADIVMLPYFKTVDEVRNFVKCVNGRAKVCLLVETPEAVENIEEITDLPGIDEIHIGINDLHLGYNKVFMFEVLADGTIDKIVDVLKRKNYFYGFGGIARPGHGQLLAEYVIAEHYRLGSNMAILSRSFCDVTHMENLAEIQQVFDGGVKIIRDYEKSLNDKDAEFFETNKANVQNAVMKIVDSISASNN